MDDTTLSLAGIFELRGQAFTTIKRHAFAITSIADATEALDFALQQNIAERSVDEQQAVPSTGRRLATLLDGGAA